MRVDPRRKVEITQVHDRWSSQPGAPARGAAAVVRGDVSHLARGIKSTLTWSRTRLTRPLAPHLDPDGLLLSEAWQKVHERLAQSPTDPAREQDLSSLLEALTARGLKDHPLFRKLERLRAAFAGPAEREEAGEGRPDRGGTLDLWDRFLAVLFGRDYLLLSVPERLERSRLLAAQGKSREALRGLAQVLAIAPDHVEAHARTGRLLLAAGEYGEAERHLQHAASLCPRDFALQMDLGELYYHLEESELARHAFLEASRLRSQHADPHAWLGVMAYEGEQLADAAVALERAVQLDPGNAVARFYLAQISLQLNDPLRARFQLDMVERLEPLADLRRFSRDTLALVAPAAVTAPLYQHRWQTPTLQGA